MTSVESLLQRARTMLGRQTLYWAGLGGEDPNAASAAHATRVATAWGALSSSEQTDLKPLADLANIDVEDPSLVLPACDCSGFVSWALGMPRRLSPALEGFGEWIFTDAIYNDAQRGQKLFIKLDAPIPGCLMVYPKPPDARFGHVGLVSDVLGGRPTRILHCSAENFRSPPFDAIKENATTAFEEHPRSIAVWPRSVSRAT